MPWRLSQRHRQHQAEWDAKSNKRLAESFASEPMRFAGLVVTDVFMGEDLDKLQRTVKRWLPNPRRLGRGRADMEQFLSAARATLGAGAGVYSQMYVNASKPGWPLSERVDWLPETIDAIHLISVTLGTGIVLFGYLCEPSSDFRQSIEATFTGSHESPMRGRGAGRMTFTVELAKQQALASLMGSLSALPIMPTNAGLLADSRYPSGAMAAWIVSDFADTNSTHWHDIARMLGTDDFRYWQGNGLRLYRGLPTAGWDDIWDPDDDGYTLFAAEKAWPGSPDTGDGSPEDQILFHLDNDLPSWYGWLALGQIALAIDARIGRLRANLDRSRRGVWGYLGFRSLESLAEDLHRCQYRLQRLHQTVSDSFRRGVAQREFPKLEEAGFVADSAKASGRPYTPSPFVDSVLSWLDELYKSALDEARLAVESAAALADFRTSGAVRLWTIVMAVLTAAVVILAIEQALPRLP